MSTLRTFTGLVTFPNEINKREGALEKADNVVIDAENTIETRRGFADFGDNLPLDGDRINQLLVYKSRVLRHYNTTLQFDSTGTGTFLDFDGTYNEIESGLRIKGQEVNGNFYFTTENGIKKISATNSSQFSTATNYITNAGGVKAVDLDAELNFSIGGFLPPQSKVAYRAVWGTNDKNGNLILGTPSPRVILKNNSQEVNTPEQFTLDFTSNSVSDYDGTVADRYVLFSSANINYFLWFSTVANPDEPQDSETLGRTGLEVDIQGLASSSDIAIAAASVISSLSSEFSVTIVSSQITIISKEEGSDLSNALSSTSLTAVTTTVVTEGSVTDGSSSNANITINVPSEINSNNFFYQLYRTAPVTVTTGLTLDDIDPGDEMNIVFEANITDAEIAAGEITFEDVTTESFRSSGAFLYTNPNTGEGILQANERPPIATDIALFRNSAFYANTKTVHRKEFNLLSVTGFTSGVSNLIIGNSSAVTEYTFVGETEISEIICDSFANTDDTGYILINSAKNERKYYIWFDKGGSSDPAIPNRVGIRVEIEIGDNAIAVGTKLNTALNLLSDFISTFDGVDTLTVDHVKNGATDDISIGSSLSGSWAVSTTTQGAGEDNSLNQVLLSSAPSVALSIEETALSLVKVINKDSNSPVNAYYLSGADDLPGIISLESRQLSDDTFYVSTGDINIRTKFNPEPAELEILTAISTGNPAQITAAGHGLVSGSEIFIYNSDSTPSVNGTHTVTVIDPNTFSIPVEVLGAGTTGNWFLTSFASDNLESPNRVYYSKIGQPEAVPLVNFLDIGPKDKKIERIIALRDNLFVMKEDGVYIITGSSAPNFGSRLLDGSTQIIVPDSAAVLNNKIYALSTQGVVTVTEGGVSIISRPIENKILEITNSRFNFRLPSFGVTYESDRAYMLWLPTKSTDTVATQCYRYNVFTTTWTRWTITATAGIVNNDVDKLYLGAGDRNVSVEERKNGNRTDFSDRDFELSIPINTTSGTTVGLSSVTNIDNGDVLIQTQYITISSFNRLLLKLDIDNGLDDTDYSSTLRISEGDQLDQKLNALNQKLVADDDSGIITSQTFSVDFATAQTQYNTMVSQLNNASSDAKFDNYATSEETTNYEGIVLSVNSLDNNIQTNEIFPFLAGPISVFKGIETDVIWAPQHFGTPDILKQVREGTIIFDQNNFYSGTVLYSSDRSKNFEETHFLADGVGFWSGNKWGSTTWGGSGREVPLRTLIPREKQRCRYIRVRFKHVNAREDVRIVGVSFEPRQISTRGYR